MKTEIRDQSSASVGVDVPGVGRVWPDVPRDLAHRDWMEINPAERRAAPERGTSAAELRREDGVEGNDRMGDGIRTRGMFDEPWRIEGYKDWHAGSSNATFFVGVGDGLAHQVYELKGTLPNARHAVDRLIACVNTCAGIPTAELDGVTRIYESRQGGAR